MRVTTAALYRIAYSQFAIPHFNVANMEQILGVFEGARLAGSPVIIAFSPAAWDYAGPRMLEHVLRGAEGEYPEAVFAVHHDHGNQETCSWAVDSGYYTSVMIDASHQEFKRNIEMTRRVVEKAHERGISVEAELGVLAGDEDGRSVQQDQALLTRPDQAAEFVERSGADSLAVAVGTSHGAYKFSGETGIRLDRLAEIQRALPGFPLVLHGASAVPPDEVARINSAGGKIGLQAKGVDETILPQAIRLGVTKVNIGTDGRLVWTRVHREFFRTQPGKFDLAGPGKAYIQEYAQLVAHKCRLLGSASRLEAVRAALQA